MWRRFEATVRAAMDVRSRDDGKSRFRTYVEGLESVIGHADRVGPLRDYCVGLMLPGERKSVEPMAAKTAPARTAAQHQKLLHFVGVAGWSDDKVMAKVGEMVLPEIERHGPIEAWIIDDTGFPKKGVHSVGVARQYCGQLGKQDNCQVAVSLSIANHHASLPVVYRLYLPQDWAKDAERRSKVGVPADISFKTKPEIALDQIRQAYQACLPHGVVLMDPPMAMTQSCAADLGVGLSYAAGIQSNTLVWPPGAGPKPGRERAPKKGRRGEDDLVWVKEVALGVSKKACARSSGAKARPIGCPRALCACVFASDIATRARRSRGRVAADRMARGRGRADQILALDPSREHLLPPSGRCAELRWRIERVYQELEQEVGLGHYAGRGWRVRRWRRAVRCGLRILICERETAPPLETRSTAALPATCRSRRL